jgi:hypothetical protein
MKGELLLDGSGYFLVLFVQLVNGKEVVLELVGVELEGFSCGSLGELEIGGFLFYFEELLGD